MNFQGAETMMREATEKVSRAYNRERASLQSKPDTYLQGYIEAYEGSNIIGKFLNGSTLKSNEIRYKVARQLLEEKELKSMDNEELKSEAELDLGFFASFRKTDRRNKARELLESKVLNQIGLSTPR